MITRLNPDPTRIMFPNLRGQFESVVEDWGSHILYIRLNKKVTHECWKTVERQPEGLALCPECYGLGHPISIERHLARFWAEAPAGRESQAFTQTPPGRMVVAYESFAFRPKVMPKVGDRIFKIDWHPDGRPRNLLLAYEIKQVMDLHQEQGDMVFWKCYASVAYINNESVEVLLRQETRIRVID